MRLCLFGGSRAVDETTSMERRRFWRQGAAATYARIGHNLGEANALQSLGDLALQRRRTSMERRRFWSRRARNIRANRPQPSGRSQCASVSRRSLARRRDDLDGAKAASGAGAAPTYARIGDNLGEANALQSLGDLAASTATTLRWSEGAFWSRRRATFARNRPTNLGEANSTFLRGLASTQNNTAQAEAYLADAAGKLPAPRKSLGELRNAELWACANRSSTRGI